LWSRIFRGSFGGTRRDHAGHEVEVVKTRVPVVVRRTRRGWWWIALGVMCWRRFWELMVGHADQDRFIFTTYAVLYVTFWLAGNV
jgi:hypothetical protein